MATAAAKRVPHFDLGLTRDWPLALGFASLAIPTCLIMANQAWSKEDGAQGPLILAIGAWLLWRQWPSLRREASVGPAVFTFLALGVAMLAYVAGRMFDYLTFEAGGLYLAGLAILHDRFGGRALRHGWFPLFYLAFAVPPPGFVIDHLTAPLKHFVAFVATNSLATAGLPVAREGVTITIAQYQLLVADACSGMNSLIGLTAISLLYIYLLRRASIYYSMLLTWMVIPIAIAANIVRIMAIILITYMFGDEVGQSFIHMAAGLFLFSTALALIFALDTLFHPIYSKFAARR
jgi:exosortase B